MLDEWQDLFIDALEQTGNVSEACKQAHVARSTAYYYRTNDECFRFQWDEVVDHMVDELEIIAFERAKTNPAMMRFLLQAHKPEIYKFHNKRAPDIDRLARLLEMRHEDMEAEREEVRKEEAQEKTSRKKSQSQLPPAAEKKLNGAAGKSNGTV